MTIDSYLVREWWLVRHAPVEANGLIYGHLDLKADFSNRDRMAALAKILPNPAAVVSSDLGRCKDTARKILDLQERTTAPIIERAMLREQNFGRWEGKPYQEVEAEHKEQYQSFFDDPVGCRPEGGESFQQLVERVDAELLWLDQSVMSQDIILITHAGVIRALVGLALGIMPQKMLSLVIDPLSLTHLTSFHKDGVTSWRVNFLNEMSRT
jgi:alpha-ribazole phosphatase